MLNKKTVLLAGFAGVLAWGSVATLPAQAAPIQFGSNYYDFISADLISWQDASVAAAASSLSGTHGHLATITSAAENDFLSSNFATFTVRAGAWLGGLVNANGTGIWQVGPEAGQAFSQGQAPIPGHYSNWPLAGIEPNNAPSFVYMSVGTLYQDSNGHIDTGQWSDDAHFGIPVLISDPVKGYFVEFEAPNMNPIPEPETYALMLAGLGLLGFAARRRKQQAA